MPIDNALLETIRAKAEGDRTPAEVALLAAAEETSTPGAADIDWEKAFQHPRFKKLVEERNNAQAELKKIKDKQDEETGNYKALYETAKVELEAEKGKSGRADQLETALKRALDAEMALLTPEAKKLVPNKLPIEDQLDWIATNRAMLTRQKAQDIGAGGGRSLQSQKPATPELTAEEKAVARQFGYTDKEYLQFREMGSVDPFSANRKQQQPADENVEE